MRVTQRDIARLAKVSQATVSRVLSGDSRVEDEIRERVEGVMREQNYKPDVRARALRNQRSGLIGLVIKRPQGGIANDPFYASLIGFIVEELSGTDFHLCIDIASTDFTHEALYDEMLRTRRVDGLILVESEAVDERVRKLQQDHFPFVLIGNPLHFGEVNSVDNDNVLASEMVTKHLIDRGYRRIGFLGAKSGMTVSDDRIAGYQKAIRNHQDDHLVFHCDFGRDSARVAALEICSSPDRPDALVVLDDFMALGVASAARELGIGTPQELGLASFNDTWFCDVIGGGLTSMNPNIKGLVSETVKLLIKNIDSETPMKPVRTIVPCTLSVRNSTRLTEVIH